MFIAVSPKKVDVKGSGSARSLSGPEVGFEGNRHEFVCQERWRLSRANLGRKLVARAAGPV